MGDGDKPDRVLPTVQMPRGAKLDAGAPELPSDAPAPLLSTMVPSTAAPIPSVAPPAVPSRFGIPEGGQDWRYTITSEIARGGMGRVVEATDTVLGRTVALKEALSADPDAVRRFQRETRITARLEHPAIVPVHDAGFSPNGTPFYVMRKIGGRPLEELVARADSLNQRLALVPHMVAVAAAVAHAHERGIVHRDIKPSNILVGDLGETIMIDWGLAKAMDEADDPDTHEPVQRVIDPAGQAKPDPLHVGNDDALKTRAGIVFGTPGFMAPEQLRGARVDERCDVYALGATLYHLLARRPPHHAKNAGDMMRAAVDGPPTPLAEIVEGVPPELVTIVDKALAHDASARYQDAGALAEDLQRFLTGQLVASHQYSARERALRFIRKHKAAVSVSAIALALLLLGGTIAIGQILDERDRADHQARIAIAKKKEAEEQREKVLESLRQLTLTNARHISATDPTRAAAMVKPLIKTELWREARDVAAAARANGVAFTMPASPNTLTLELSRDGQRALAAGDDGIVRIYELGKRDSRVVADTKGAVMARFADGERKILLFQGNRLTIVDAVTGTKREVTAPTAIEKLEVSGPIAYWVDPAHAVWKLDLAGGAPAKVPLDEPVTSVAPSPDGRWIALAGAQHLLLLDRTHSTLPAEMLADGATTSMTWSADSEHLVILIKRDDIVGEEIIDFVTKPVPKMMRRVMAPQHFSVAYSGGRIYGAGPQGVGQVSRDGTRIRSPGEHYTLGVHEGRENVVISAKPQGAIIVLSDYGDHTLKSPAAISIVAASARGPWIVAAAEGVILAWNLDAIEPRVLAKQSASGAAFVTPDHVIATFADDPAQWFDLRGTKNTELGVLPNIASVAPTPDGADAVVIDGTRRAWRVAGVGQPQELPGEIAAASFIDNHRLVIAGPGGLRLEDQRQHTQLALFAHDAAARALVTTASDGGWIAASFEDGLLWRKNLKSGAVSELRLAPPPTSLRMVIAADGTVVFGADTDARAWRVDGTQQTLLKVPKPIQTLALVDPKTALVLTDDGVYLVYTVGAGPSPHLNVVPFEISKSRILTPAVAIDGSLLAAVTVTAALDVIDPIAKERWEIAKPKAHDIREVQIAPDGSRVLAITPAAVLVWTLALPRTADDTAVWLDKLTNAVAETPTGPLTWR